MCIGIPMQAIDTWPGGALARGRQGDERIDTRLVGEVASGDWLLVFQGAAREHLAPERAAEIDATLALLEAALAGDAQGAGADPGFVLPSSLPAAALSALTGSTGGDPTP